MLTGLSRSPNSLDTLKQALYVSLDLICGWLTSTGIF